ncbi:MAG: 4'-phosphopantetheinyl transferase superfamily protein [Bacteroides sp.]|uniref:4'-phosphopantetheinyl transferase superfamily protein n=1 Tax=Bacteroides sp. TaxID=29523 RepID=UPI002FC8E547
MAIYVDRIEDTVRWGVWKMDESVEELLALLPTREPYEDGLERFTALHRKLEWLSVRVLLYQLLGKTVEIGYEPSGKPYLVDHSYFISISHTKGYVAVILSTVSEVGIDIEQYGPRIHKVAHKFMRDDEVATPYNDDSTWPLLLHWSAKEVMFKCMDAAEVDFREHLRIFPFAVSSQGEFQSCEYRTDLKRSFLIHYQIHADFVLTWCAGIQTVK